MLNKFRNYLKDEEGFTLVELLVVIIIIGILAAIALPIFLNQQKAAFTAHAKSDLRQLQQASELARVKTGKTLMQITGSNCTSCGFSSIDPLTQPETHSGWVTYKKTLKNISDASGVNINGLLDANGRPYFIDENEGENGGCTTKDSLSSFSVDGPGIRENTINLPLKGVC